jgi:hypothetical protein
MKILLVAAAAALLVIPLSLRAQDSVATIASAMIHSDVSDNLTFTADSVQTPPKRSLLPSNMSFVEKGLWGENGLVRSIGIASPLTPDVRKHELDVRRTMLTAHQIGGFVTLGLMISAVYTGQRYLNSGDRSDRRVHDNLVGFTVGAYGLTAALSVLSPPPVIRRDEMSTTSIHKTLAWVHFLGMVVTPIIGATLRRSMNYDQMARFHQIAAYVSTAAMAASMIIITF